MDGSSGAEVPKQLQWRDLDPTEVCFISKLLLLTNSIGPISCPRSARPVCMVLAVLGRERRLSSILFPHLDSRQYRSAASADAVSYRSFLMRLPVRDIVQS